MLYGVGRDPLPSPSHVAGLSTSQGIIGRPRRASVHQSSQGCARFTWAWAPGSNRGPDHSWRIRCVLPVDCVGGRSTQLRPLGFDSYAPSPTPCCSMRMNVRTHRAFTGPLASGFPSFSFSGFLLWIVVDHASSSKEVAHCCLIVNVGNQPAHDSRRCVNRW